MCHVTGPSFRSAAAGLLLLACLLAPAPFAQAGEKAERTVLRLWYVPDTSSSSPVARGDARVLELYRRQHPRVVLRETAGIQIPQITGSAALLMAIAGGIAPDVIDCYGTAIHDYAEQKFLLPLDDYIARFPEAERLSRAPRSVWDAARLRGADGRDHVYAIPAGFSVGTLKVRHDLIRKFGYTRDTMPKTWDELYAMCRQLTDPDAGRYGIGLPKGDQLAEVFHTFLVCAGGRAMEERDGKLTASFDSEAGVLALDFLWKLLREPWERDGKRYVGVAYSDVSLWYPHKRGKFIVGFHHMSDRGLMRAADAARFLLVPMPRAPNGKAVPLISAYYTGLFGGQSDRAVREAAFDYIWLRGSSEGRRLATQTLIDMDAPTMANPLDLERFGFTQELGEFPEGYADFYRESLRTGTVEQNGPGAAGILREMKQPVERVLAADLAGLSDEARLEQIRGMLKTAAAETNRRLYGAVAPRVLRTRKALALLAALAIFGCFAWQILLVQRAYAPKDEPAGGRGHRRSLGVTVKIALALLPAVALVALWEYFPLIRGTVIAFQDYRFIDETRFVGVDNFMTVLFSPFFWAAMGRTVLYVLISLIFGFFTPIFLAIMLHELPRGTVAYRVLYYLPALTSGIVVMFLWKSFYEPGPNGYLNYLLSFIHVAPQRWLEDPNLALLWCVLPVIWAGIGPGSLIYQAALKSIPEDLFEAAAIDGCGFWGRLRYVAFPYMKPLVIMNFVGVFIGTFKSSGYILVLTGGGPDAATTVASLEIFYEAYARLSFGTATAMSWLLAFSLIGFTLFQIRYLSRVEFRSAGVR